MMVMHFDSITHKDQGSFEFSAQRLAKRQTNCWGFCATMSEANAQKDQQFGCPVEARLFAPERCLSNLLGLYFHFLFISFIP
jgi:hypothetical protein